MDINSVVVVLRMLGFICSQIDRAELRTWLLNNNCFTQGPDFLEKHVIFIDKDLLIGKLKELKESSFGNENYMPNSTAISVANSKL